MELTDFKIADGVFKHIKVEFENRKCLIPFTSHDEFIRKCREKFKFGQDEEMLFTLPGDDTEIDSECITDFPNNTALQLQKARNDSQTQNVSGITSAMHQLCTGDSRQGSRTLESKDESVKYEFGSDEYMEEIQCFKWGDDKALLGHLSVHGTKNIASLLDDSLRSWRRHQVNIAVIGQSGKGKSSLINALRGVTEAHVQGATVGEKETTRRCTSYKDPKYDNIVYWDVPGCGTINYPQTTYLLTINYQKYDYFLIVSSERFHEMDIWLAQRLMSDKDRHRCYFIRSKVDIDMANRERRERLLNSDLSINEIFKTFKLEVKTDIIKALCDNTSIQLFLLSSHYPNEYEFQNLQLKLIEDALIEKRLSLALGMNGLAKPLLDYKRGALRSRQRDVALRACSCIFKTRRGFADFQGSIPDIIRELKFYREQLSLDDTGLQSVASTAGITAQVLTSNVEFKTEMSHAEVERSLYRWYRYYERIEGNIFLNLFVHLTGWERSASYAVCSFLDEQLNTNIMETNKLIEYVKARKEDDAI